MPRAFSRTSAGEILYRPTTGPFKGTYVRIKNADVLDRIGKMAGYTTQYLARDAANAAFSLADTWEEMMADAVRGKVVISVAPSTEESYLVEATVLTEPEVRRTEGRATVFVDRAGRVLRGRRYRNIREAPSISRYVAQQMHIALEKAMVAVRDPSRLAVQRRVLEAARKFHVKIDARGRFRAPAGGIEIGGKYYKGGVFIPI